MKKYILAMLVIPLLAGCAGLKDMIPSFWDSNQSQMIINVRQSVDKLNCNEAHAPQVQVISDQLHWFELYSESKKTRDVQKLIKPMQETVADFLKRSNEKQGSAVYCEIKKKAMATQAKAIASAVLGRY
jgi:hypothetical protein